ncbi:hypothetical protein [Streptomyces shaanxiensis]
MLDAVELSVSELVTNAYLHTEGPASLRLTGLADGRLRVGVWDRTWIFRRRSVILPVNARSPLCRATPSMGVRAAARAGVRERVGRMSPG